jgi:hypothetical protein
MREALSEVNHGRLMVQTMRLAQSAERNPTPGNIRKWRHKLDTIMQLLDNVEEVENREDSSENT